VPAAVLEETEHHRRAIVVASDEGEDAAGEVGGLGGVGLFGWVQDRHRRGDCSMGGRRQRIGSESSRGGQVELRPR